MAEPSLHVHFNPDHLLDPEPFLAGDFPFTSDLASNDFDIDIDLDFSADDILWSEDYAAFPWSGDASGASSSSPNPKSAGLSADSADSGNSLVASVIVDREAGADDEKNGSRSLKRKQDLKEDGGGGGGPCFGGGSDPMGIPRSSKFQRSEDANSPSSEGSGEDDKRKARLMRNRESAHLSRQRKKQYVEDLEKKVRSMHSTITDLSCKISYFMAENASLRQQLSGSSGVPAVVYPPVPGTMAPVPFSWIPSYALRPQESRIPLVPLPNSKSQQLSSAEKSNKKSRTKKVAGVSLLGLFFIMLLFGGIAPGLNLRYMRNRYDMVVAKGGSSKGSIGRILSVTGRGTDLNSTGEIGLGNGTDEIDRSTGGILHNGRIRPEVRPKRRDSWSEESVSEPLTAFLYVPKGGKHVKINGNLIIQSVLASEKAMTQTKDKQSMKNEETGLTVAYKKGLPALSFSKSLRDTDGSSNSYKLQSDSNDGPLQQWFYPGMTGSILSSGMCTEVFQFVVSPTPAQSAGIVPVTSIANASVNLPHATGKKGRMKNRRILHPRPIPFTGSTVNETKNLSNSSENNSFHGTKPASSMLVSVLADPREAGDSGDGRVSPKSISRIFVVVLIDSVKYVTYSCVLPFKSSSSRIL